MQIPIHQSISFAIKPHPFLIHSFHIIIDVHNNRLRGTTSIWKNQPLIRSSKSKLNFRQMTRMHIIIREITKQFMGVISKYLIKLAQ